eukprot:377381_1
MANKNKKQDYQPLPDNDEIFDNEDENIEKQNIEKYYKSLEKSKIKTIIKKQYKYKSDFDDNGIIYALGIDFDFRKHKTWENPAQNNKNKKIILTSFPIKMDEGSLHDMIGRQGTQCQLDDEEKEDAWIMMDFVHLEIHPTYYTLRHGHCFSQGCLQNWNLEAMDDDNKWICLDKQVNNSELAGKYKSASWPIRTSKSNYYTKYRIKMTGEDRSGDYFLCCSGFEIYGDIRIIGNKQDEINKDVSYSVTKSNVSTSTSTSQHVIETDTIHTKNRFGIHITEHEESKQEVYKSEEIVTAKQNDNNELNKTVKLATGEEQDGKYDFEEGLELYGELSYTLKNKSKTATFKQSEIDYPEIERILIKNSLINTKTEYNSFQERLMTRSYNVDKLRGNLCNGLLNDVSDLAELLPIKLKANRDKRQ